MKALFLSSNGCQVPRKVLMGITKDSSAGNIEFSPCKMDDFWKMLRSTRFLSYVIVDDSVASHTILRSIKRTLRTFYAGTDENPLVIIFSKRNLVRFPRYGQWQHAKNEKELLYLLTP